MCANYGHSSILRWHRADQSLNRSRRLGQAGRWACSSLEPRPRFEALGADRRQSLEDKVDNPIRLSQRQPQRRLAPKGAPIGLKRSIPRFSTAAAVVD